MAYQRCYFPMKYENLSQGYGSLSSSHKNSYALDYCGKDSGKDTIFAPFDCKVTKLYQPKDITKHANTVWLTSTKKVLTRNGYYGYLTISFTHPNEISKMKLGKLYKQGDVLFKEGNTGLSSGNHVHIELSKGTKAGWEVVKGDYVNINRVKPEEYFFLKEDSVRLKETYKLKKYHIDKESEITKIVNSKDGLNMHSSKDYNDNTVIYLLKDRDDVILLKTEGNFSLVYRMGKLGWVSKKYLK